jgi:hypothetical protein
MLVQGSDTAEVCLLRALGLFCSCLSRFAISSTSWKRSAIGIIADDSDVISMSNHFTFNIKIQLPNSSLVRESMVASFPIRVSVSKDKEMHNFGRGLSVSKAAVPDVDFGIAGVN